MYFLPDLRREGDALFSPGPDAYHSLGDPLLDDRFGKEPAPGDVRLGFHRLGVPPELDFIDG